MDIHMFQNTEVDLWGFSADETGEDLRNFLPQGEWKYEQKVDLGAANSDDEIMNIMLGHRKLTGRLADAAFSSKAARSTIDDGEPYVYPVPEQISDQSR